MSLEDPVRRRARLSLRAVQPKDGRKSSVTLLTAFHAADAFFESGMRDYRRLHELHETDALAAVEAKSSFMDYLHYAVPAGSNLSFALELYLKVLRAQRSGLFPGGHPLGRLFNGLPASVKPLLRERFWRDCEADRTRYISEFSLRLVAVGQPLPLQFKLNFVDDNPPDPNDPNVFAHEIDACDLLYERWRYAFERGIAEQQLTVRFFSLIHMCRAVAAEIESFAEGSLIAGEAN